MQGFFSVADEGCPFDALCRVSFRGNMLRSYQGPMRSVLSGDDVGCPSGTYAECPFGSLSRVSVRGQMPSLFMKFTWHANPHYRYL